MSHRFIVDEYVLTDVAWLCLLSSAFACRSSTESGAGRPSAVLASVDDAPSLLHVIDDASSEIGGRAAAAEAATDVLFVAIVAVGSLLVPGYVCR